VPLFIQWDKQWGYKDYIGNVAGLSACGPTCLSMVTYYFTRDPAMTPAYMMDFAEKNGYGIKGSGTQWSLFGEGAKKLGLDVKELTSEQQSSEEKLAKVLESGRIIVVNVRPGIFTTVGHYMVIAGYEDGKFRINDPNSPANSQKLWSFEEFDQDVKMMWSFK
jgi:ABC-type bacteriocin/lantibiotic exporter with double-glycine peptidase domain